MTPPDIPSPPVLSALHRRFPDRLHLWAGRVRVWRAELPVRTPAATDHPLARWVQRAAAHGPPDPAERLGLPASLIASVLADASGRRAARRSFAFLDLPAGPVPVPPPADPLPPWPSPLVPDHVPVAVLRPDGVDLAPPPHDLRTVPVIWAEALSAVAVRHGDAIDLYAAAIDWRIGDTPWVRIPADDLPPAGPTDWADAWTDWCQANGRPADSPVHVHNGIAQVPGQVEGWLWAGPGPLREAALLIPDDG